MMFSIASLIPGQEIFYEVGRTPSEIAGISHVSKQIQRRAQMLAAKSRMDSNQFIQLAEALEDSRTDVERIMQSHVTPKISILLSDRSNTVRKSYDLTEGQASTAKTTDEKIVLYGIASASKLFVSYLLQLSIEVLAFEKEEFRVLKGCWDRPFDTVLEEASNGKIKLHLGSRPTVKDLLSHVRGFPSMNDTLLNLDGYPIMTKEEFIQLSPTLFRRAASTWTDNSNHVQYSNANFIWLEILVEEACGKPIDELLKEHVFRPCGMQHTYTTFDEIPPSLRANVAYPYVQQSDDTLVLADAGRYAPKSAVSVALGMFSCVEDLGMFYHKIRQGIASLKGRGGKGEMSAFWNGICERGSLLRRDGSKREGPTSSIQYFSSLGLSTDLDTDGPGSLSMNRILSASRHMASYTIQSKGKGESVLYTAWARTGYCGASYYIPQYGFFVIVMGNAGPFDAADHISRLLIQNFLDLNPPSADIPIASQCQGIQAEKKRELKTLEEGLRSEQHAPVVVPRYRSRLEGDYFCTAKGIYMRVFSDDEHLQVQFRSSVTSNVQPITLEVGGIQDQLTMIPNEFGNDQLIDWKERTLHVHINDGSISLVRFFDGDGEDHFLKI